MQMNKVHSQVSIEGETMISKQIIQDKEYDVCEGQITNIARGIKYTIITVGEDKIYLTDLVEGMPTDIQLGWNVKFVVVLNEKNKVYTSSYKRVKSIPVVTNTPTPPVVEKAPEKPIKQQNKKFFGRIENITGLNVIGQPMDKQDPAGDPIELVLPTEDFTFEGKPLTVGNRYNLHYNPETKVIVKVLKVYEDRPTINVTSKSGVQEAKWGSPERQFKMTLGNLWNVAYNAVGVSELDKTQELVEELYQPVNKLRDCLVSKYKETHHENDIGAKLGDALKSAANCVASDIQTILSKAEEIVAAMVATEIKLKDVPLIVDEVIKPNVVIPVNVVVEVKPEPVAEEVKTEKAKEMGVVVSSVTNTLFEGLPFDDNIPFSPIALQYRELLGCM